MKNIGLYVHIPFCVTKCIYCSFYSIKYNKITAESYKSAVIRNVHEYKKHEHVEFDTVYFGGGTPSLLYREISEVIAELPLSDNAEITVEANPCDINSEMLEALLNAGVNRISIGVQSLNARELRFLKRRHDSAEAVKAVELAHQAGFNNISVDIMLGIPAIHNSQCTMHNLCDLPIQHISAYILEYSHVLSEDETAELYLSTVELLEQNGFKQYEISNFAKPGYECQHNLKYWNCLEYIGIGSAAHSYYRGKRFAVESDAERFINSPLQETYVTEECPGTLEEKTMLQLRLTKGVELTEELSEQVKLIPAECLCVDNGRLSLTPKGFLMANRVIGELL
ncbi:MAG: radical SAM family heme chaperone HemW [Oscillospiraceae bacterium]|nr:radical SAM family heme chaperone HemW [Oscillospiraceae bacterium]